jgi:AcrR family transcriptional regulator
LRDSINQPGRCTIAAMGTRADKKAATRAGLAAAARRLVLANGYDATTVDEVAAAAGVSRATFFRYFTSKEAAFFADQQLHLHRFDTCLRAPMADESPVQTVRRACLQIAAQYVAERTVRLAVHRVVTATPSLSAPDAQLDGQWEAVIATALGEQFAGPQARVAAGAIIGVMRAVVRDWFAADCKTDLVATGEQAFALLAGGLGPPPSA